MPLLNPRLHAALNRVFGVRTISNAGQPMAAVYSPGPDGRPRLTVSSRGEAYVVACPYCHDTSGHLYVNHRWGVRDPRNGTLNLWMAKCFLSDCMKKWENRKDLLERVEDYALAAAAGLARVPTVTEIAKALVPYNLPHDFQPLTELSPKHCARRYVRERGFIAAVLTREWGVGFSAAALPGSSRTAGHPPAGEPERELSGRARRPRRLGGCRLPGAIPRRPPAEDAEVPDHAHAQVAAPVRARPRAARRRPRGRGGGAGRRMACRPRSSCRPRKNHRRRSVQVTACGGSRTRCRRHARPRSGRRSEGHRGQDPGSSRPRPNERGDAGAGRPGPAARRPRSGRLYRGRDRGRRPPGARV